MSGINELDRQGIESVTGYQFPVGTAMDTLDELGRRRGSTEQATGISTALPTRTALTRRGGTRSGERPAYREEMQALLETRSGRHRSPLTGEIIETETGAASDLRFMTEATQLLGLALQHPSELADSTLKTQVIGLLAEGAKAGGIVLANTLSTLTRRHLGIDSTGAKAAATAAYAAGTLIADTFNPDLISWATRHAGGVEPKTYFSVRKGASALGAYNEIAAATLINTVKSVGYGAITVGVDSTPAFSGYGRVAVALIGAVGNAVPSQLINHGLNAMTLNRAGVSSHRELPPLSSATIGASEFVLKVGHYTRAVRARMLFNHIYFSDLSTVERDDLISDNFFLKVIDHQNFNPRLIELLTSADYVTISGIPIRKTVETVLANPQELWEKPYRTHISDEGRALMLALYFNADRTLVTAAERSFVRIVGAMGLPFPKADLPAKFRSAVKEIEGSVLAIQDRQFRFANPGVRDFLQRAIVEDRFLPAVISAIAEFEEVTQAWRLFMTLYEYKRTPGHGHHRSVAWSGTAAGRG
jgi:hypothetical protein